jgi:hypothetical protein
MSPGSICRKKKITGKRDFSKENGFIKKQKYDA